MSFGSMVLDAPIELEPVELEPVEPGDSLAPFLTLEDIFRKRRILYLYLSKHSYYFYVYFKTTLTGVSFPSFTRILNIFCEKFSAFTNKL